ncbi:MAG: DUF3568 family protein [candidate division NC10 bacterium]|nr:DUF3568 family protein [candidate division NC10 bacterium]
MRRSRWLRRPEAILFLVLAGAIQGCPLILLGGGAAGGGAGVAYSKGEQEQVHAAPYDKVWEATLSALRTLNITVSETAKDQISAKAIGAKSDGTSVAASVLPVTKETTSVRIRIGTFGDRPASEQIQGEIAVVLKEAR